MADFDTLLDEMDAERIRVGRRCYACTKLTPEHLAFIHAARQRGHSANAISRKLRDALGIEMTEAALSQHFRSGHEPR